MRQFLIQLPEGLVGTGFQIQGHKETDRRQVDFYCELKVDRIYGVSEVFPKSVEWVAIHLSIEAKANWEEFLLIKSNAEKEKQ